MADPITLHIPSTRALLTSLITTLATSTQHSRGSSNPLSDASENTKSTLLTLHTFFPTDLLPALDLLDRGLVTRFVLASASASEQQALNPTEEHRSQSQNQNQDSPARKRRQTAAYYVRTAQQQKSSSSRSSRSHNAAATVQGTTSYEVHLAAWNCSCPAFTFAAFPAELLSDSVAVTGGECIDGEDGWRFGGLARGDGVPACKHLLACVIAEHCAGFEALVEEKEVGVEEVAGWAAGWGD